MAEVDAAPAVSTSEAAPAPYDESLLIKDSKGKVKRPTKPDDTERNKQIEKLQEQITKYSERIKDIKATIESKRGSGRNTSGGTRDIIKRLQDLRNQFQSVLRQKQHIRDELNETNKSREDTRAQLRNIREKTNQTRVEDIEIKIHELEDKLRHDTLSVRDEKSIHDQISKLNAAKPLAKEHVILTERLQEIESIRTQIIERLKECDAVLNDVKAQETEERANLDKIKAAESGETSDVPSMHVEKQECYQIIVSLRDKITQIRNDFNDKYQEWVKLDKAYNAWNRHQKKLQYEERKKEREEREQQRQTVAAADLPDPYEAELISCDQMVAYLKRLQGSQEEVVASTTAADLDAPAPGMKLLRKKNDDELEGMFAGFAKKGKGAKKGGAEAKKAPSAKKLVHDLDTLKTFMMLKVDVPQTTAELAKACEAVTVRKAEFLKKREDAKNAPPPGPKGVEVDVNGTGPAGGEDEEEVVAEEEHEKQEDGEEEGVKENGDVEVAEEGEEEKVEALARGVSVTLSVTDDAEVSVAVKVSEDAEA